MTKPPLLRTISSIENGDAKGAMKDTKDAKQADKLIEAEKSETGTVRYKNLAKLFEKNIV